MAATAGAGGARDLASVAVGAGWLVVDKSETGRPTMVCCGRWWESECGQWTRFAGLDGRDGVGKEMMGADGESREEGDSEGGDERGNGREETGAKARVARRWWG